MKKNKLLLLVGTAAIISTSAYAQPTKQIALMEAFTTCDVAALKNKSGEIAPGLKVTKTKSDPSFKGQTRMVLTFNKSDADLTKVIKQKTGYDFTNHDPAPKGAVSYEINEEDGGNYIACSIEH